MSFSANPSTTSSEINVTPLIDVLLMLLIIFMVIVPVMPRGLDSSIPQPALTANRSLPPVSVRLLVLVGRPAVYEIDGKILPQEEVKRALLARLGARAERSVYVAASPQASYRLVAELVGEAKAAGAATVALGRL